MRRQIARAYLILWAACHFFYPLWYSPSGRLGPSLIFFLIIAALLAGLTVYLRPALSLESPGFSTGEVLGWVPRDGALLGLLFLIVLFRTYPLSLPLDVYSAGDEIPHVAFPALPFKVWSRYSPIPIPVLFWTAAAAAYFFRDVLRRIWEKFVKAKAEYPAVFFAAAALGSAVYFIGVFRGLGYFIGHGHENLSGDLLRFPPLGDWIRFFLYAAFGASNLTGRLPEFLFFIGSGLVLYRLVALWISPLEARLAAAVFWLLPASAYYAIKGTQTHGEVFFYLLTAYFYVRWSLEKKTEWLYWAALAVSLGVWYRYTVIPLAFILSVAVSAQALVQRRKIALGVIFECLAMMALAAVPWTAMFYMNQFRAYHPFNGSWSLEPWLSVIKAIPRGVSWPIAGAMGVGFLRLLMRRKDWILAYLIAWFCVYYAFISRDIASWPDADIDNIIRFSLPLYPILSVLAAEGLLSFGEKTGRLLGLGAAAYLLAVGVFVHASPLQPQFTLRQGLKTEYVPLPQASAYLDSLPLGTRLLAVDGGPGCFSFYMKRPQGLEWIVVESKDFASLEALRDFCRQKRVEVVMYRIGTNAVDSETEALRTAFAKDDLSFKPAAEFVLGGNKILMKNFVQP